MADSSPCSSMHGVSRRYYTVPTFAGSVLDMRPFFPSCFRESSDVAYAYACIHQYICTDESDIIYANLH